MQESEGIDQHLTKLRVLDMDDLLLLQHFLLGGGPTTGANLLGLSPPAVSHRLRKLESVFSPLFEKKGTRVVLNKNGKEISHRVDKALKLLST